MRCQPGSSRRLPPQDLHAPRDQGTSLRSRRRVPSPALAAPGWSPSPSVTARRTAASASPPTHSGGWVAAAAPVPACRRSPRGRSRQPTARAAAGAAPRAAGRDRRTVGRAPGSRRRERPARRPGPGARRRRGRPRRPAWPAASRRRRAAAPRWSPGVPARSRWRLPPASPAGPRRRGWDGRARPRRGTRPGPSPGPVDHGRRLDCPAEVPRQPNAQLHAMLLGTTLPAPRRARYAQRQSIPLYASGHTRRPGVPGARCPDRMSLHSVRFTLNGEPLEVTVPAERLLIELLRDELGATGTKLGCGVGVCGACTVLVDDRPMSACLLLAVHLDGTEVRTVEGLAAEDGTPTPLQEAFDLLQRHGDDAHLLAGGTAMVLLMAQGLAQPDHVIGLRRVEALRGIRRSLDGGLEIGATVTHAEAERSPAVAAHCPALRTAFGHVATVRIRNQATVGGNLAHADPAQDPPPMLLALGAEVIAASPRGQRRIPLHELFVGFFQTSLEPDEIVTAISLSPPDRRAGAAYLKFLPRTQDDYATVSVAAWLLPDRDGRCARARIALGAAGAVPLRARRAEESLTGRRLDGEAIAEAAALVREEVDPIDDARGSAAYKREMARVWTERALHAAAPKGPAR